MNTTLLLRTVLDQGASYTAQRSPGALERRTALAAVMHQAGIVTDPAVALRVFVLWQVPQNRTVGIEEILTLAEKSSSVRGGGEW